MPSRSSSPHASASAALPTLTLDEAVLRALAQRKTMQLEWQVTQEAQEAPLTTQATAKLTAHTSRRLTRAVIDAAAFARRFHRPALHQAKRPRDAKSAAVFDALERARVECIGVDALAGARHNLQEKLAQEAETQGYHLLSERADPPLAELLAAVLRQRSQGIAPPPPLANLLGLWQPWIEREAGADLAKLITLIDDQRQFAEQTLRVLEQLSHLPQRGAETLTPDEDSPTENAEAQDDTAPDDSSEDDAAPAEQGGSSEQSDDRASAKEQGVYDEQPQQETANEAEQLAPNLPNVRPLPFQSGYRAYTRQFDEITSADALANHEELTRLRAQLDSKLSQFQTIVGRLSSRLQRLLLAQQNRRWVLDEEDGVINSARLSQVVVRPDFTRFYKVEQHTEFRDTVVTLLIDNSGSMRGRPITMAALSADILARTLERCGVKVEILGFTTRDWKGGQARKQWLTDGKPATPGRLNDLRHIIYKAADTRYPRARKQLGLMLKEGILKENIDGEALLWACERLERRPEQRRILMVISDGAPVDDSTLSVNPSSYLDHHLREVIHFIENNTEIELLAIGIGHDVTRYYKRAVTLSDVEKLGDVMIGELTRLFKE